MSILVDTHFENVTAAFSRRSLPWFPALPFPDYFAVAGLTVGPGPRPNTPPTAAFTWEAIGNRGVVRLDAGPSGDPDPDPSLTLAGNGIVAYGWDLDGDGAIDAFGRSTIHRLANGAPARVTLCVWDHQGASTTTSQLVAGGSRPYPELLVDAGFERAGDLPGMWALDTGAADRGWHGAGSIARKGDWLALQGGTYGGVCVAQIVHDRRCRVGPQHLTWNAVFREGGGNASSMRIEVWGVDSEFRTQSWGGRPEQMGAILSSAELLCQVDVPPGDLTWQEGSALADFRGGFEFVYVCVYGRGIDARTGDIVLLDQVSITGAPD
jgi:hypothetical protein